MTTRQPPGDGASPTQTPHRRREIDGLRYQVVDGSGQLRIEQHSDPLQEVVHAFAAQAPALTRLVDAIDSMAEGFILFDSDDRLVLVNARYREFYPGIADLLVPGTRYADIAAQVALRAAAGQPVRVDGWVRGPAEPGGELALPDGRWVRTSRRQVEGGGIVRTSTDITELKLREAALRELERLKSEFLNNVSHELRTPLTAIHASLGLLAGGAAGPLPDDAAGMVGVALRNSDRLLRLVNDLLDFGSLNARGMRFEVAAHDLDSTVRRAVDDLASLAADRGVAIRVHGQPGARAMMDQGRFVQALTNLLGNAVKFSSAGATVDVAIAAHGGSWRVSVADKGPGIAAEHLGRIFDRFYQAGDGAAQGGTGLGLSIARNIMQNIGGDIGVESKPGAGSTFWLEVKGA
jgi:signal transduction histidine kinase